MWHWIAMFVLLLAIPAPAGAQQNSKKDDDMQGMPGMDGTQMPGMNMGGPELMTMHPETYPQEIVLHAGSGTSAEPDSTPVPMLMTKKGKWNLMFHANVFVLDEQQSSPRGGDKFFSTNWFMGMAQRALGPGVFTARAMLSLEPATITGREYPLLFQQGETAFGKPIVDGQHPHNFFMEIAALYDLKLGKNGLLSFYAAPDWRSSHWADCIPTPSVRVGRSSRASRPSSGRLDAHCGGRRNRGRNLSHRAD